MFPTEILMYVSCTYIDMWSIQKQAGAELKSSSVKVVDEVKVEIIVRAHY